MGTSAIITSSSVETTLPGTAKVVASTTPGCSRTAGSTSSQEMSRPAVGSSP